jgi:hypothetical protein
MDGERWVTLTLFVQTDCTCHQFLIGGRLRIGMNAHMQVADLPIDHAAEDVVDILPLGGVTS